MASLTAAATTLSMPSFCGLKALTPPTSSARIISAQPCRIVAPSVCRASLDSALPKVGSALLATSAAVLLAASANAAVVKMGDDDGSLKFVPSSLTISAGETIVFKNNAGFPHNVVFDEDDIPSSVKADAISHEEYLNGPGEEFSLTLTEKGTYKFYCEPHQGGGMKGEITVT